MVIKALAASCHPEPVVAVTAITTSLAVAAGMGPRAALVAVAVFTGQLSIGWANDYIDRDRDRAARRTDKPVALGAISDDVVRRAAAGALLLTVPLSFLLGWRSALAALTLVACGWIYNLAAKATAISPLPYVVGFGAVPSIVTLALPQHHFAPLWASAGGALLGVSAHFTNVLPDLDDDRRAGIRGLPHRLGRRRSLVVAALLLAGACAALAVGPEGGTDLTAVVLLVVAASAITGIVVAAGRERSRGAFRLTVLTAVVAVALLVLQGDQLQ